MYMYVDLKELAYGNVCTEMGHISISYYIIFLSPFLKNVLHKGFKTTNVLFAFPPKSLVPPICTYHEMTLRHVGPYSGQSIRSLISFHGLAISFDTTPG